MKENQNDKLKNEMDTNDQKVKEQKQEDLFEPGDNTKKLMLGTRSRERFLGGLTFPGLFPNDEDLKPDLTWFGGAITLELIGLSCLCYALWEETSLSAFYVILIGLIIIGMDVVFAWIHHFTVKPLERIIKNEIMKITPSLRTIGKDWAYKNYREYIMKKMPLWRKTISLFSGFIIIFMALSKAVIFIIHLPQAWSDQVKMMVLGPCIISYGIVAYIHLTKTGFCIAYWRYKRSWKKDNDKFYANITKDDRTFIRKPNKKEINLKSFIEELKKVADEYPEFKKLIPDDDELKKQLAKGLKTDMGEGVKPHKIIKKESDKQPVYEIQTSGRLTDEELEEMVKAQPEGIAQTAVALYGHWLQCEFIAITE